MIQIYIKYVVKYFPVDLLLSFLLLLPFAQRGQIIFNATLKHLALPSLQWTVSFLNELLQYSHLVVLFDKN